MAGWNLTGAGGRRGTGFHIWYAATLIVAVLLTACEGSVAQGIDYDDCVHLDAESLAEVGIRDAYEALLPRLRRFVPEPVTVEENWDELAGRYVVVAAGREYVITSPGREHERGGHWARATYALFDIVNSQIESSDHRFHAINGGNDLFGIFLTAAEARSARNSLERKSDWPYLPTLEGPWYGIYH